MPIRLLFGSRKGRLSASYVSLLPFVKGYSMLRIPLESLWMNRAAGRWLPFRTRSSKKRWKSSSKKPIEALEKQIIEVEKKIKGLIKEDDALKHLFDLVTSVDGVGEVVFCEMVIATNEFKLFSCPRKFACYSGVAPFEHSSGTSIRGGTRVSHLANKQMKKLLHMAALSVVSGKGEMADYYHRKVEQGKNKMLVINAVRNKIIHRVFACIRDDRKYEKNYTATLV